MERGFRPGQRAAAVALTALAAALVFAGWRLFWFLTDDAFIAFRYVSNRQLGFGYVWNPPPFLPVEGYTSFLWVVLLDLVWTLTGVEPPAAANALSLLLGYGSLALAVAFVARMELPAGLARWRLRLLALVLLGIATNRTFLTWLSGGLETALFNVCFTGWIYLVLRSRTAPGGRALFGVAIAAVLAALSRPDGLLAVVATAALALGRSAGRKGRDRAARGAVATLLPLLLVPAHLLWRRGYYGSWLPNTYYAKHTAPWPASGWRYAASFVLEYGGWIWLAVALAAAWASYRDGRRPTLGGALVALVVAAHVGYYTLVIGGDHFEWRVYSYLIPLAFVSFVWLACRAGVPSARVPASLALFVVASWPVPWTHYALTRQLDTRGETRHLFQPLAAHWPWVARPYAAAFDRLQGWLIARSVCMRHQEHRTFWRHLVDHLPPRVEGQRIGWDDRPVLAATSVGVVGWALPHVAILDGLGLNDYVVARSPVVALRGHRQMAHDRRAPAAYERCYRPNLLLRMSPDAPPKIIRRDDLRQRPLTDADIARCEAEQRALAVGARGR